MKYGLHLIIALLLLCSVEQMIFAIELGDSKADVVEALGRPRGSILSGDYELLNYERGRVELQDGEVVSVDLMTPQQLEEKRAEDARRRAERRRRQEQLRRERYERGLQVKDEIFESAKYEMATGAEKVRLLNRFHEKYPEVDVDAYLIAAMAEKETEDAKKAEEERMARLEGRVEEAEWKAQQADWKASAAAVDAQDALRTRYYRQRYYKDYDSRYRPRNFGLSVGYESPGISINYTPGSRVYHHKRFHTGTRAFSGDHTRKTFSTRRFDDGF